MISLQGLIPDSLVRIADTAELEPIISKRNDILLSFQRRDFGTEVLKIFEKLNLCGRAKSGLFVEENVVTIGQADALTEGEHLLLEKLINRILPWRTGPFSIFGHQIDAEWQSWMKWDRISPALPKLTDARILDVGCGNGYFMLRLLAHNPELVLGLDPIERCYYQFMSLALGLQSSRLAYLPFGILDCGLMPNSFDLAICLGVLYHQRDPVRALSELAKALKPGGALILETLALEGCEAVSLCPPKTFLGMPNVHFVPTTSCLEVWLERAGFGSFELINSSDLDLEEQRATRLSPDHSLKDFLSAENKTIEGYEAPIRVAVRAIKN